LGRTLDAYCRFAGLHVTQEDLAHYVESLFSEDRAHQERVIRQQLRREKSLPWASAAGHVVGLPMFFGADPTRRLSVQVPQRPVPVPAEPAEPDTASDAAGSVDVELTGDYGAPQRWPRWAIFSAALIGALLLGLLAGRHWLGDSSGSERRTARQAAPAARIRAAPPAPAPLEQQGP
jgi:hypothetical protein